MGWRKSWGSVTSGNPMLDQVPWIEQPTTQLLFEARSKEDLTIEEFEHFFMVTCRDLPDLPFAQLAHANEAELRVRERTQRENNKKK